jgi:urease accessory protein
VITSAKWSSGEQRALSITGGGGAAWRVLDAEFDARTPSPAMRAASRQLGSGLRRLVRTMLPDFDPPWQAPHHPMVLGAAVAAAGGTRELAARAAALNAASAPASAAVRLLGLDPLATHAMLGRLAADIDAAPGPTGLPPDGAPALDLLADYHLTTEVRLFAS